MPVCRHCEPSGLAFGKPKDRLREAIQGRQRSTSPLDCFVALLLAMTMGLPVGLTPPGQDIRSSCGRTPRCSR